MIDIAIEMKPKIKRGSKKEIWIITVSGYGSFEFVGTESEAEEMRIHKANCERGIGKKVRKSDIGEGK